MNLSAYIYVAFIIVLLTEPNENLRGENRAIPITTVFLLQLFSHTSSICRAGYLVQSPPGERGNRVEVLVLKGTRRLLVAIKTAIMLARFSPNAPSAPSEPPKLQLSCFPVSLTFLKGPRLFRKTTQGGFRLTLAKSRNPTALCVYLVYYKQTPFQVERRVFPWK